MANMPSFAEYSTLTAAQLNALADEIERIAAGTFGDIYRTTRPVFKVLRTTAQTIAASTDTMIVFNSYTDDPDGMWDSSDPTRVTVRRSGLWQLNAQERWANSSSGDRAGKILVNGPASSSLTGAQVSDAATASYKGPARADGEGTTGTLAAVIRLQAGDILRLNAWHSASASTTTATSFGGTWFSGVWIGP